MTESFDGTPERPPDTHALQEAEAAMDAAAAASESPVAEQVPLLSKAQAALADLLVDDADPSPERP